MDERPEETKPERPVQVIVGASHFGKGRPEDIKQGVKKASDLGVNKESIVAGLVIGWPNNYDVWALKFASPILAFAAGWTGFYLNKKFRDILYLGHHLRISTFIGLPGFAALTAGIGHNLLVTFPIFRSGERQCPVCTQVRGGVLQVVFGVGYPMVLAPVMSYLVASSFKDRHLPKIHKRPTDVLGFVKSVYKPMSGTMGYVAAGQLLLAMGLTYMEQKNFFETVLPAVQGNKSVLKKPENILQELF